MPRVQDAIPGNPQRAWQRRANPVLINPLHLAPESTAADPNHPNHAEAKEWLDEYDPKVINELPIKYALSRMANRRNAAKTRLANKKQTPSTS